MTLGRPLVSPGFAACHVPADRSQCIAAAFGRGRWAFFDRDFNLNLQRATMTHVLGQLCPLVVALLWGSQMSTLHQRHLPVVTDTITYLNAQIRELNRLRGQVRKAELSARRARKPRRKRAKTPIEPGRPQDILGRPETAANDNQLAWPFIPFPEGWNGS
jgi:hypothetical protein